MENLMPISGNDFVKIFNNITDKLATLNGNNEKSKEGSQKLIDTLYEMDSAYKNKLKSQMPDYDTTIPKTTFATKKEYNPKTDEEIEQIAENTVKNEYDEKYKDIIDTANEKKSSLNTKLSNEMEESQEDIANAKNDYLYNNYNIDNTAVEQGLKNSSIYDLSKKNNYSIWQSMVENIQKEFETYQKSINMQINQLNLEKRDALLKSDLSYALDKENEINELYKEQAKAIEEINSYNKKITEAEIKYNNERLESISNMENKWWEEQLSDLDYQSYWGYEGSNASEMENRYNLAKDYYTSIAKKDAKTLLSSNKDALQQTLGVRNYAKLVKEING